MKELEQLLGLFVAAVILAAARAASERRIRCSSRSAARCSRFSRSRRRSRSRPELALALFVAPVLLDAAFDASLRDLRDNWAPVTGLVDRSRSDLTTAAVAVVARTLVPAMPWAAAIALGAIVAPPDAVAATAVLRPLRPPHRILTILEGESLLNDASALLIYRLAVGAVAAGGFSFGGGCADVPARRGRQRGRGPGARVAHLRVMDRVQHVPTSIILQFVTHVRRLDARRTLGLSGVLTMVCYAITVAQTAPERIPARIRIPTYAVWETVVFALNILAFIFIGLQIRPILESLEAGGPRTVLRGGRRGPGDGDRRAPRLAHVLQCGDQVAAPPVRISSAAADAAADRRQRPDHLVGRHARHRLARRGAGASVGVSVSRSDRADGVLCRPRHAGDPGPDAQAAVARARSARRGSGRPRAACGA